MVAALSIVEEHHSAAFQGDDSIIIHDSIDLTHVDEYTTVYNFEVKIDQNEDYGYYCSKFIVYYENSLTFSSVCIFLCNLFKSYYKHVHSPIK